MRQLARGIGREERLVRSLLFVNTWRVRALRPATLGPSPLFIYGNCRLCCWGRSDADFRLYYYGNVYQRTVFPALRRRLRIGVVYRIGGGAILSGASASRELLPNWRAVRSVTDVTCVFNFPTNERWGVCRVPGWGAGKLLPGFSTSGIAVGSDQLSPCDSVIAIRRDAFRGNQGPNIR